MALSNQQGIEEVFIIKTKEIDLFGAMVRDQEGRSMVNGRVWFQDGTWRYFNSLPGKRAPLRRNLVSLCDMVATIYGTDVFHLKFDQPFPCDKLIHRLRQARQCIASA